MSTKRTNAHDRNAHQAGGQLHELLKRAAEADPDGNHDDLIVEAEGLIRQMCQHSRLAGLSKALSKVENIYGFEVEMARQVQEASDA